MKIKIGNTVYDPNDQPLMVILTKADKKNICSMSPGATKYCAFPGSMSTDDIEKFMMLVDDEELSEALPSED